MQLGSQAHKELFCKSFIESHLHYEPETLPWPELDGVALERLRGIPFWLEALKTERNAGNMVSAFAETIDDPLIQEAIALQGREETRHGRLIEFLIERYNIEIEEPTPIPMPKNIETAFTDFGFCECLDSYFAFGMFDVARQAQYLPEGFFTIFDPILHEEARHIVFFINWFTYQQINQGLGWSGFRGINTLWHYKRAVQDLISIFKAEGQGFTITGANNFMDNLTPELFFSTCVQENARRMNVFEAELLQPKLLPNISKIALGVLKFFPKGQPTPATEAR
ncbi:conserved hypothetical protein [Gloeothece citriformis PCC 7424]|uniref:Ferritin-like domain-containing protein n=1 Tax=Gloeothece citriformis (strain PCC 7424) TaxID=65393 RepID=B7KG92_GLOC7|nr:ferritin-like domain-containing protein [Gloeothece citriformis]ACK70563.1 conserved hypothetical protein [Gloeothece citriformis PCC 7424]